MATQLSPPFQSPMVDQRGNLLPAWLAWFNDLWRRTGGSQADSNTEITQSVTETNATVQGQATAIGGINDTITAIQNKQASDESAIDDLNTSVAANASAITAAQNANTATQAQVDSIQVYQNLDPFGPSRQVDNTARMPDYVTYLGIWT